MMTNATINISADEQTLAAYKAASAEQRRKIGTLLGIQLGEYFRMPEERLEDVMDEIGRKAAARGLTPEILDSILSDDRN